MKSKWTLTLVGAVILSSAAQAAMSDFSSARGTVLIAAPTAINGPTNQGVWFLNPSDKSFSLTLPALSSNEIYEGWIVDTCTGSKTSTGAFKPIGGVDSDAAGPYAGPLNVNFPPQPGSDFVTLGHNLTSGDYAVVVTVEPYPNTSGIHPAGRPILKATIPSGSTLGTQIILENVSSP